MEKEFIVETRPTGRERELTEGRTSEVHFSHKSHYYLSFDVTASHARSDNVCCVCVEWTAVLC